MNDEIKENIMEQLKLYSDEVGIETVLYLLGKNIKVKVPMSNELWIRSMDELNIKARSANGLKSVNADSIGKVAELIMSEDGLTRIRNLGKKSISEIKTAMLISGYNMLTEKEKTDFWRYVIEHNCSEK